MAECGTDQRAAQQLQDQPSSAAVGEAHRAIAAYNLVQDYARLRSAADLAIILDATARALRRGCVTPDQLVDMRTRIAAMDKCRVGPRPGGAA